MPRSLGQREWITAHTMKLPATIRPLLGKHALVMGGSRGIGRAVALALAHRGATTSITYYRNEGAGSATLSMLGKIGRKGEMFQFSAGQTNDAAQLFETFRKTHPRLDILVYCVGMTIFKPLAKLTPKQVLRIVDLNANGFFQSVLYGSTLMKQGASIVALSSLGSQRVFDDYGGMGVAKACIEAMVRYLAVELANQRIRVNAVVAGPVETSGVMAVRGYKKKSAEFKRLTPSGRIGSVREVADVVAFLSGGESSWITGQSVVVDGGLSLRVGTV